MLDFGCAKDGEVVEQTVELVNSSFAEAFYQMDLDLSRHSVFSIHPASGTVRPHSKTTLRALYRPMHPIVHRRRVACLILHRVGLKRQTQTFYTQTAFRLFNCMSNPFFRSPCSLTWLAPVTQSSSNRPSWNLNTCFSISSSVTTDRTLNTLSVPHHKIKK